jgi:hypothetical protein
MARLCHRDYTEHAAGFFGYNFRNSSSAKIDERRSPNQSSLELEEHLSLRRTFLCVCQKAKASSPKPQRPTSAHIPGAHPAPLNPRVYISPEPKRLLDAVGAGVGPVAGPDGNMVWRTFRFLLGVLPASMAPVGDVGAAALRFIGFRMQGNEAVLDPNNGIAQRVASVAIAEEELQVQRAALAQTASGLQELAAAQIAAANARAAAAQAAASQAVAASQADADAARRQLQAQSEQIRGVAGQHAASVELITELRKKLANAEAKAERRAGATTTMWDRLSLGQQHALAPLFSAVLPEHMHLLAVLQDQAKCKEGKARWCHWSKATLDWCGAVYLCKPAAYGAMGSCDVMILPSEDTVKRHLSLVQATSGHSVALYESLEKAARGLRGSMREVVLIFDEVSLVGQLAFKLIGGEYQYVGMVDSLRSASMFGSRAASPDEESVLKSAMATHALVFQVADHTGSTKPRFRRICGIHAVRGLTADRLHTLFWETVGELHSRCGLQVLTAVCDGAGCNRLWQKMQSLGRGARGTPNHFVKRMAWCWNIWVPGAKIFLISDPAHMVKKSRSNFYKSKTGPGATRTLLVPAFLVLMILRHFPSPDLNACRPEDFQGDTVGEEWYMRVFGRLYFLLASGAQPLYNTADPTRDPRVAELLAILWIVRTWREWLQHEGALAGWSAAEIHFKFLSHQIAYDIETMIEGFIALLEYREQRWGEAAVRVRQLSQDSLESLFGRLRYACGGGDAVSMQRALQALPREDERTQVRWRSRRQRMYNSGRTGEGIELPPRYRIILDQNAEQQKLAVLATTTPHVLGVDAYLILWHALASIVAIDEDAFKRTQRSRLFHWLSVSKHMVLTGFSCMRVGLAVDVLQPETPDVLQFLRLRRHPPAAAGPQP